jgi:hypothetical protein
MTKLETVHMIGDTLTQLDMLIGSLLPSDPNHRRVLDLRLLLDDRQRRLSRQIFDEGGDLFQRAARDLAAINDDIRATMGDIGRLNTTIANVTRLLNSVTSVLTTVAAVA